MVKKYESGLTVVVEQNTSVRSVAVGILVGAGSAYETETENGISHFIEHMQFKGTQKRTAEQIVKKFDDAGASYNAFTGKEYTCYYFNSIDEKTEECFEILSDLFLNSEFPEAELERERKVILEEINMGFDEPDGVCYDVLCRTMYKGALGREILGTKSNVSSFGKADILEYKRTHYLPSNTVIGFVGNITETAAAELVEKYMNGLVSAEYSAPKKIATERFVSGYGSYFRDYEQSEISVAYPSLIASDERVPVLSALDCLFGKTMSSRLFQRLREKMGLVYSVYSSPSIGTGNGFFSVCANVSPVNAAKSVEAIGDEIRKLVKDGVTDEETERAKTQLKASTVFGKEKSTGYMLALMRWRLLLDKDYNVDELLERIGKIRRSDINELAREIFSQPPALAYVGKKPSDSDENIIKRYIEQ